MSDSTPSWLQPSHVAQPVPQSDPSTAAPGSPQGSQAPAGSQGPPPGKALVSASFIFGNIGFSVLASAAGALGIAGANSVNDTAVVFVGLYLILFSAILVGFEVSQFRPGTALDQIMKKNLGFLYGPVGRSIYIIL
jgi:hypothetical protein